MIDESERESEREGREREGRDREGREERERERQTNLAIFFLAGPYTDSNQYTQQNC